LAREYIDGKSLEEVTIAENFVRQIIEHDCKNHEAWYEISARVL
jgi:hypothetical protein